MSELRSIAIIFGGAFSLGLTGAVVPGPMFAATVMHARSRGWLAGVSVSSGHAALELLLMVAIVLGAGAGLAHPAVARSVAVAGGCFLVVMGLAVAVRPPRTPADGRAEDETGAAKAVRAAGGPFVAGVWTSVSQPYFFIWWATVGAGAALAALATSGYAGTGAFYVGHILADFAWFTLVAAAVGAGRKVLSDRVFTVVLRVCGAVLAGFGVFFLVLGIALPGWLAAG